MNESGHVSPVSESAAPAAGLHQRIYFRQLFTMGVGTIVGVAWLMVLGSVLAQGGPLGASVAFVIGACAMIPIGLCYAELAGMLPFAGGEVVYAFDIFGARYAYVAGVCLVFAYLINCIFFSVSVGWLAHKLIPGLQGPTLYSILGEDVQAGDVTVGVATALLIGIVNYRGAHVAARLQDFATYGLLLGAVIFVVAGIVRGNPHNLEPIIVHGGWAWGAGGILSVLAVTPYFFGGFNTIPQALSELRVTPGRAHIAGMMSACILVSLVFLCAVLVSVAMTMPRAQLLSFDLPIPEAFAVAFHSRTLANIVLLAGLVGLLATWNALFFASTRALLALGRGRLLPAVFGTVHRRRGTPSVAVLFALVVTAGGTFLGKGVLLPVVNVTSTIFALLYVLVTFATYRCRQQRPEALRPYRVPGRRGLILFALAFSLYLAGLSLYQQFVASSKGMPIEWEILLLLIAATAVTWEMLRGARTIMSDEERRRAML